MKYLEHMAGKEPHERRNHALRLALGIVAVVLLGWIVMLPLRFAAVFAQNAPQDDGTQTASAVNSQQGSATLLVATSTQY